MLSRAISLNEVEKNVWLWISAPYESFSLFSTSRCKHHPVTPGMSHNWQHDLNITSVQPTATTHTPLMWQVWKHDHLIYISAKMPFCCNSILISLFHKKLISNTRLSPLSLGPWSGRIRRKLIWTIKDSRKKLEVLKGELISPECVSAVGFTQASAVWRFSKKKNTQ